jgi:hypothetical protein
MKKTLRRVALGLSLALSVGTASAEKEGLFYGAHVADADVAINKAITGAYFQLGYQYNEYVGAEARVGIFSNEASSLLRDPLYKQYALLGRVGYAWEQISAYALLGYANTLSSFENSEDGFSKGVEINLFGSPSTAVSIGYLSQTMKGDDFNTVSIGFVHFLGLKNESFLFRHPSKD